MNSAMKSIAAQLLVWSSVAAALVILSIVAFIRFVMIPEMTNEALVTQTQSLASTIKGAFSNPAQWSDEALSKPDALDAVTAGGKTVATLFLFKNGEFVRAATTLKKADGSRAVGTALDSQSAAFKALNEDKPYSGQIKLFDRPHMATYLPVSLNDGRKGAVFVGIDFSSADGMVGLAQQMVLVVVVVGVLGILLLAAALVFAIRKVLSRRLGAFLSMSEELAHGKGDLTVRLEASKGDELSRVATAFNVFLDLLHSMFVEFKVKASQMGSSSLSLSSVVQDTNRQIQKQQEVTSKIAAAVEEISVSIDEVASHAKISKETSHAVSERTVEGVANLTSLSSSLAKTENSIGTVTELTKSFILDVGQINNLVTLVSEIADQTNLLALNAAIEAARAGEMGRGFAVVADEVRKLATRSNETVNLIRETTNRLGGQSDQVSNAMESSEASLHECVARMEKVKESLAKIESLSIVMAQGADDVESMVAEQSIAVQDIAQSMESVASSGESTANQMGIGANIAAQLEEVSKDMSEALMGFKTSA